MNRIPRMLIVSIAAGLLLGIGEPLRAQERAAPAVLFEAAPLDASVLDGLRGGSEDATLSTILATGTVSEVSASDLVTGHNIVSDGSLAGASGLPMLIQNSGNGVLIQNAVIVNVDMN